MASTQAMCNSFKTDILSGIHALGTTVVRTVTTADSFKAALYFNSATLSSATTAYTSTGELGTGSTNYTAGGVAVTWLTPVLSSSTACTTPNASISYTTISTSTDVQSILIYNFTQSNKAVAVYTFTAQIITSGTLQLTMPNNSNTNALLRIA